MVPAVPGVAISVAPGPRALARITTAGVMSHPCTQYCHGQGLLSGRVRALVRGLDRRRPTGGNVLCGRRSTRGIRICGCGRAGPFPTVLPLVRWEETGRCNGTTDVRLRSDGKVCVQCVLPFLLALGFQLQYKAKPASLCPWIFTSFCSTAMVYSPTTHWHEAQRRHHPPWEGNHGEAHRIMEFSVLNGGALAHGGDPRRGRRCLRRRAEIGLRWRPQPTRGRLGQ